MPLMRDRSGRSGRRRGSQKLGTAIGSSLGAATPGRDGVPAFGCDVLGAGGVVGWTTGCASSGATRAQTSAPVAKAVLPNRIKRRDIRVLCQESRDHSTATCAGVIRKSGGC